MRVEMGFTREGKCEYKGIEFDVQIIRFSKYTEVKFSYEVKRNCYWHTEGYRFPHWLDKLTWYKPAVWFAEKLSNRAKEKLYVRAMKTIRKEKMYQ